MNDYIGGIFSLPSGNIVKVSYISFPPEEPARTFNCIYQSGSPMEKTVELTEAFFTSYALRYRA